MFSHKFNDYSAGAWLLALAAATAAVACGELAQAHMKWIGTICGASDAHCGWCYAAAGFTVAAGMAVALALQWNSRPRLICVKGPRP
jgi:hypothetical protein